jgi:sugar lactone lactonase YvrE
VSAPRPGGGAANDRPLPGVRAVGASVLLRPGSGAPPGGELAFLAVDPSGNLIVSDSRRHTVMRFDPSGHLLSEWGPQLGSTTLAEPAGVAAWGDHYYVVDRGTPRIFQLDSSGAVQATIGLEQLATYGLNGLAVDTNGSLYATDTGRNRILIFAPNGQFVKQIGRGGKDLGSFMQPMMIAFGPDRSLFITDWENNRIQRWSAELEPIDAWSIGFHSFGVAVDASGRLFVPDTDKRRVQAYTPRGIALGELGTPGSPPLEVAPKQVAIAGSSRPSLYVLGGDGIQRLDLENTAAPPQTTADVDVVSLIVIALLIAVLVLAVLSRRARRATAVASVQAPLDRPVRLHPENGAQPQHQQPERNQDLLIPDQAKREQ